MLLHVNPTTRTARRITGTPLKQFGLDERGLQDVLFRSLDRLIGEDELLLLMQSRHWQEEPDLMALDREGKLYIFEIKVWESRRENLLQVLRYGQINGGLDYDGLNQIWQRFAGADLTLEEHIKTSLTSSSRARSSMKAGVCDCYLDVETRLAVKYWNSAGLEVRPWIYKSYSVGDHMLLEISPFRTADDPFEDREGQNNFYVVNTHLSKEPEDNAAMLREKKAAAFSTPWKFKIERLRRGDHVFLYRSGIGVIAVGTADGKLRTAPYHGQKDEEYAMGLLDFGLVDPPLTAAEVKTVTSNPGLVFRQTMFSLDREGGAKLSQAARARAGKG